MLYQYINASYQGTTIKGQKQGQGIVVDNHNNFICSNYNQDKLNGPTFICLYGNILIYGMFKNNKMEGINTIDSDEYKVVGNYIQGKMIGKGVVISKSNNKIYMIDNDKVNIKTNTLQSPKQKLKGWQTRLLVTNRYTRSTKDISQVQKQLGIKLQNTQIQQFLQSITHAQYKQHKNQFSYYFGFVGLKYNLGVTISTSTINFQSGLYSQPFVMNRQITRIPPQSANYIHQTIFFPQLISIKQHFINILSFINIFQEQLLNLQNSEIFIRQQSQKSQQQQEQEERLLRQFNFGQQSNIQHTIRRSVALEKLNKSLGELLIMQEQMLKKSKQKQSREMDSIQNHRSKQRSRKYQKDKWLLSLEQQQQIKLSLRASKMTLKQQMYNYMQQCQSHVIPRQKSRTPTKFIRLSDLQSKYKSPHKTKLKSILKNRQYTK